MAEVAAERIARAAPIMPFHVNKAIIKIISPFDLIRVFPLLFIGKLLFVKSECYLRYDKR
jgi:hypothetical protein